MAKEKLIEVTLAKGQSLSGPNVSKVGGDTVEVTVECAARWEARDMIEPLEGADAKAVARFRTQSVKETATATPADKETAEG